MCSCPYSYHNQHRQSVTHLRSFPSLSQESVISPLLQKPTLDKDQLSNYRPISNLSLISKIIERVVKSRLLIIRCLQWSSQSQTVRLLQASLHWNSSAVYPWSSHQCHRITEVVLSLPPWSVCRFWHHRPQHPNRPPFILVWNSWLCLKLDWVLPNIPFFPC